ncbi:F-box/kelch-repeat protein At3g23880-like [Salvia miltiorrhiza]|uniref:F-box/kelch-repeat protein At3g23880-like n=1 Tax=Salvia miltiorrhiza TaxID=226208 RepID=UPI0025AC9B9F|nr:F-box/kelch-repeat protein At3g23880-like [Salvia miltiorrhiza]
MEIASVESSLFSFGKGLDSDESDQLLVYDYITKELKKPDIDARAQNVDVSYVDNRVVLVYDLITEAKMMKVLSYVENSALLPNHAKMLSNDAKIPQNAEESVLEISQNPQKSKSARVEIHKEIIEEILSRLPVKSLLRFRCVSKPWRSLIDSKWFIKTHLQNSARNPSLARHKVLLLKSVSKQMLMRRPVLDSSEDQALELEFPIDFDCIVGSCNGLVCLVSNKQFVLWNPSTGISKKLPPYVDDYKTRYIYYDSCGFGWDESSGDYKVFAATTTTRSARATAMTYSLKRDSWKEVKGWDSWKKTNGISILGDGMRMGMLASGSLHWEMCDTDRRGVVAFDLKREVIGAVELPECSEGFRWLIGVIGECLLAYYMLEDSSCVDIWMKKKESWEKVVVLDQKCNPLHISPALAPFWGGGFLLIKIGNFLVFCGKGFSNLVSLKDSDVYIESLVSPLEA